MFDWLYGDSCVKFIAYIAIRLFSTGVLPCHIAVIMDGNRRWAKNRNLPRNEGHKQGIRSYDSVCDWIELLGVPEITFYAFSTDNFKRSEEEVNCIMDLLLEKLQDILTKIDVYNERGIRVRVFGNLDLLPLTLRSTAAKVILLTKDNRKLSINLAIAYKSSEEIVRAAMLVREGVDNGELLPTDIDEQLFEKCLYTGSSYPPDFLIRTSGEYRLSDFMLWQLSYKLLYITTKKWPDFSFFDIFKALLYYQHNEGTVKRREKFILNEKNENDKGDQNSTKSIRIENFLKETEIKRNDYLRSLMESNKFDN